VSDVLIEGYTVDELLGLSNELFTAFVLRDEPLVLKAGSAEVLGQFKVQADTLYLELGHIDGGGEGALPSLAAVANRYARREGLSFIEWRVHAVHCANPNLKLRRVLTRKGFVVREIPGVGECYWLKVPVGGA
jgi:hypothetical protein